MTANGRSMYASRENIRVEGRSMRGATHVRTRRTVRTNGRMVRTVVTRAHEGLGTPRAGRHRGVNGGVPVPERVDPPR